MRAPQTIAVLALGACATSGCVAAALPVAAAAGLGLKAQDSARKRGKQPRPERALPGGVLTAPDGTKVQITPLKSLPPPSGTVVRPVAPGVVPPEMQYLYGSGEAAAASIQAYRALWQFVHGDLRYRRDKAQISSVVMTRGATLASPKFDTCGERPQAVVLDVDETSLLNLGFEADVARRGPGAPYDAARWARWEATGADKVVAVPGAAETLAAIRGDGVTVIFNSNRTSAAAAQTAAALEHAGLGPAVLGDTLWLRDEGAPSGKDERRWKIAERYCVVAMVGDQLGDFSDLFNAPEMPVAARRNSASETLLAPLWGAGWFMLPNPVYGSALKGGIDDVFPRDKQWADPAEEKK